MTKNRRRESNMVWQSSLSCCWVMLALAGCAQVIGIKDLPDDERPPVDAARPSIDASPSPDPPWWNPAFQVRVRIAIDNPPTDEDLRDVPVLVVLDQSRVDYGRTAADGRDLRFVDEGGNELEYEIERWDPSGQSFLWVRMPVIASGASTQLWLYHDNPAALEPGAPSVWSDDYLAVWHLAEAATAGGSDTVHRDATGRGNDGAQNGNGLAGAGSDAIGGAQAFDGDDDYIELSQSGLQESGTALTLLARAYVDGEPNDFSFALGSGSGSDLQWQLAWARETNTWAGRIDTETSFAISVTTVPVELYTWYLLAMVYDGTEARLYVDGEPLGQAVAVTGNLRPLAGPLYIGNNPDEGASQFDGIIDEVRIARVARSPSWLRVQHASMNDDLLDFATTECLGGC
jgi:biopolymer transport protein ExbB